MDPFNQVQEDGEEQVKNLSAFLEKVNFNSVSSSDQRDFDNQVGELHETIEDLKESIDQIKSEPELYADLTSSEIQRRENVIKRLVQDHSRLNKIWKEKTGGRGNSGTTDNPFLSYEEANDNNVHNTVAGQRGARDLDEEEQKVGMNNMQLQQELHYQDEQLDGVYNSVLRINQQARLMGDELEDQAGLISEFEQDMDRTQGRLSRSHKRLKYILEKNRERFSDCCIMVLVVALIVLLVLIIIL